MNLISEYDKFQEENALMRKSIMAQLANMDLPLEERWTLFQHISYSNPSFLFNDLGFGYIDIFDPDTDIIVDLEFKQNPNVLYVHMYNKLKGYLEENKHGVTQEQLDTWREAVLASGCAGFEVDW